jgi:hypothetical protein
MPTTTLSGDSRTSESIPELEAPSESEMMPTGMTEGTAEGDCYYDYYQPPISSGPEPPPPQRSWWRTMFGG